MVIIHVVCSDSLYQAYVQFLCFSQKLDDARFGIQPVDDDDGKYLIYFARFGFYRNNLRFILIYI